MDVNSSHAAIGVGATSAMAELTTLLTGWNGLTGDKAAAWSWLLVSAGGGIFALAAWFVRWKWPTLPPLPGEEIEVPADAKPIVTATVKQPAPITSDVVIVQPKESPNTERPASPANEAGIAATLTREQTA